MWSDLIVPNWTKTASSMSKLTKSEAERIITSSGWLSFMPEDFRTEVVRRSFLVQFQPGEPVIQLGDVPGGIDGLVSGTISISMAPAGEEPRLILLGVPGYWTGEACFLTRKPRRGDARAVVETTMYHLPLDAMDQMARDDPKVAHYIAQILMMSVEFLLRVIHDLQKPGADRRIASVLQRTTWSGEVPIPLTQTDLGVMANASRKQVNAALKRFTEAGWLKNSYRSITIRDAKALRRFTKGNDRYLQTVRKLRGTFAVPKCLSSAYGRTAETARGSILARPDNLSKVPDFRSECARATILQLCGKSA